jgi:hypothetical protein
MHLARRRRHHDVRACDRGARNMCKAFVGFADYRPVLEPTKMHPCVGTRPTVSVELDAQQTHPDGFRSQPEPCGTGAAAGEEGLHSSGVGHTEQVSGTAAQRCRELNGWLRQVWGSLKGQLPPKLSSLYNRPHRKRRTGRPQRCPQPMVRCMHFWLGKQRAHSAPAGKAVSRPLVTVTVLGSGSHPVGWFDLFHHGVVASTLPPVK